MSISRRRVIAGLGALGLAPACRPALAQGYPSGMTIKFVVPFAAGGTVDFVGRILADRQRCGKWHRESCPCSTSIAS